MKKTNKKEMRKLLNKCLALQKAAFDKGLNMSIGTRYSGGEPWFTGCVCVEGCDFTDKKQKDVTNHFFYCYDCHSVEENEMELKLVEEFINKH